MSTSTRSRLVEWVDPSVARAVATSGRFKSGLEMLRGIADGEIPAPPIARLLDYHAATFEDGLAVFECTPSEAHYNPLGVVHGGLAATLLDTTMACSIHTRLPLEVGYTTLELKVNFVRPMTVDTGKVRATGRALHVGKRTALAEGRIEDAEGRLLAHGSTTCMILG